MKGQPLYLSIYNDILYKIKNEIFDENSPIPSERDLCKSYKVSRSTVRQALTSLQVDGYIYKIHGQGTFVKPMVYEQSLYKFYSFTDELRKANVAINNSIVSCEEIILDSILASKLNKCKGDIFHKIVRLRSAQKYPLMIEVTYLPKSRFFTIDTNILDKEPLYNYLYAKYSLTIDSAEETFRPIIPNHNQCMLLNITPKTPCTLLERFSYESNSIIEYTQSIVRGDKYVFKVNLSNS